MWASQGGPRDVTCGKHVGNIGHVTLVRGDESPIVELDLLGVVRKDGSDTSSNETDFRLDRLAVSAFGGFHSELDSVARSIRCRCFRSRQNTNPLRRQRLLESRTDFVVLDRKNRIHHLNNRHLSTVGIEEVGKLNADRSSTNDGNGLGLFWQDHRLARSNNFFSIKFQEREFAGNAPGCDENILGRKQLAVSVGVDDFDFSVGS